MAEIHSAVLAGENMTSLLAQENVSLVSECSVNFWPLSVTLQYYQYSLLSKKKCEAVNGPYCQVWVFFVSCFFKKKIKTVLSCSTVQLFDFIQDRGAAVVVGLNGLQLPQVLCG